MNIYCRVGGKLAHWHWSGDSHVDGIAAIATRVAPYHASNIAISTVLAVIDGGKRVPNE